MGVNEEWTECRVRVEADIVLVRALMRAQAQAIGFGTVDLTKFITAGSELARNILKYAGPGGGSMTCGKVREGAREGIAAEFRDQGPGITDVEMAMKDGFSTGGSLGVGLPGARRLVDEMTVESGPGRGTRIRILKWRR